MEKAYKVLWHFDHFSRSYEVKKFLIQGKWCHPHECTYCFTSVFVCIFYLNFRERELSLFYGILDHFRCAYAEARKLWMIRLCLDIRDIILVNEHTYYASCFLHKKFGIFGYILIYDKKDDFHYKFFLWPQFPLTKNVIGWVKINLRSYSHNRFCSKNVNLWTWTIYKK